MDPNDALWLSKARMSELHAEAAANRLARKTREDRRAAGAGAVRQPAAATARPWIERLRMLVRRTSSVPAAGGRR
jgi:hypothetical protein